jgi:hypothetical protein
VIIDLCTGLQYVKLKYQWPDGFGWNASCGGSGPPFVFTPSGMDFYTLHAYTCDVYLKTYFTYMYPNHRLTMVPAALVFMLLTVITRSAPCSTLQSCVDDATATNATLNVILPPVLQASTGNCNVSIIGNSNFNRAVVSGSGSSRTIIDCTASGLCILPKRSAHAIYS